MNYYNIKHVLFNFYICSAKYYYYYSVCVFYDKWEFHCFLVFWFPTNVKKEAPSMAISIWYFQLESFTFFIYAKK